MGCGQPPLSSSNWQRYVTNAPHTHTHTSHIDVRECVWRLVQMTWHARALARSLHRQIFSSLYIFIWLFYVLLMAFYFIAGSSLSSAHRSETLWPKIHSEATQQTMCIVRVSRAPVIMLLLYYVLCRHSCWCFRMSSLALSSSFMTKYNLAHDDMDSAFREKCCDFAALCCVWNDSFALDIENWQIQKSLTMSSAVSMIRE